jgi:hypothetical protein
LSIEGMASVLRYVSVRIESHLVGVEVVMNPELFEAVIAVMTPRTDLAIH